MQTQLKHTSINILDLLYINIQMYITPGYVSIRFHKIILWINFELDREYDIYVWTYVIRMYASLPFALASFSQ